MTIFCNHCRLPVKDGHRLVANNEWLHFHDSCWEHIPLSHRTYNIIGHYS